MVTPGEKGSELSLSTVVSTKNMLGQVYFGIVKHVHRLIVPIIARGMAKTINSRALPDHFYTSTNL